MTRKIGFSTGAIAKGDFRRALSLMVECASPVVELSALRIDELEPLVAALAQLDLAGVEHVSFHAPSRFAKEDEDRVVRLLEKVAALAWPIVVHPGVLYRSDRWRAFGDLLLIENMDRRAAEGRTCEELEPWFAEYPDAGCIERRAAYLNRHFPEMKGLHPTNLKPVRASGSPGATPSSCRGRLHN